MTKGPSKPISRRDFWKSVSAGTCLGVGALLPGCTSSQHSGKGKAQRLRAAFSNGGLATTWCKLGHDAALLWGDLLDVDIVWFDGELNPEKQREKLELIVDEPWDFCAFQALQTGIIEAPVRKLQKRNIPVISMDTLVVERQRQRDCGVWVEIAADHQKMGQSSTQYLMDQIGGRGKVIHIGGDNAHDGAKARERGFNSVVSKYPDVEVLGGGVRWCDWKPERARSAFEALLQQSDEPIAGAFFHNDDMALACIPALARTPHKNMVITAVDGQKHGLSGVRDGLLAATTVNPTGMVHMLAVVIGQFIVRNQERLEDVPPEIPCPCPLVTRETGNLEAMFYLSDAGHSLM